MDVLRLPFWDSWVAQEVAFIGADLHFVPKGVDERHFMLVRMDK